MALETLDEYLELRTQSEIMTALQLITHHKLLLRHILEKYGVPSAKELKAKIASGQLPEHPTYEDTSTRPRAKSKQKRG